MDGSTDDEGGVSVSSAPAGGVGCLDSRLFWLVLGPIHLSKTTLEVAVSLIDGLVGFVVVLLDCVVVIEDEVHEDVLLLVPALDPLLLHIITHTYAAIIARKDSVRSFSSHLDPPLARSLSTPWTLSLT